VWSRTSAVGMVLCPVVVHGAASCEHEVASWWRELFGAQEKWQGHSLLSCPWTGEVSCEGYWDGMVVCMGSTWRGAS
jgi:hypothetical protein